MRQQHCRITLIVAAVMWLTPQPTTESVTPTPAARSDQPRVSRQQHRTALTLNALPKKWRDLAWCESRHQLNANRHDTYYGLWQLHKGWYKTHHINPTKATLQQQYMIARYVYERQGRNAWKTCSKQTNFR